jgi:transcriptional regulator GlxA family with amidase domain
MPQSTQSPSGTNARPPSEVLRIGFWLTEAFDFYALASALEPLRLANVSAGRTVCEWQILSAEGRPLRASNGITMASLAMAQAQPFDVLMLLSCASPQGMRGLIRELLARSRKQGVVSERQVCSPHIH